MMICLYNVVALVVTVVVAVAGDDNDFDVHAFISAPQDRPALDQLKN